MEHPWVGLLVIGAVLASALVGYVAGVLDTRHFDRGLLTERELKRLARGRGAGDTP